jgi:hypothetical protein
VKLEDYVRDWDSRQFDWSNANCGHFASGWVRACEGWSPIEAAGEFADEAGVASLVAAHGSLSEACSYFLRRRPVPATMAGVGDLVLLSLGAINALGVCNGRRAFAMSHEGVVCLPMSAAISGWKVGGNT